jgi:outer membrane protein OmpA-like peptidoglycan-associated protein
MRIGPSVIATALGLAVFLGTAGALAQSAAPSESDISRSLAPKSRGLPNLGDMPAVPANPAIAPAATGAPPTARAPRRPSTPVATQPADAHPSATLHTIQFQFGSAELTPDSIETLKNLGNALNHELADQPHFVIEGHTDAYGEAGLNEKLSTVRAEAVKDYLVKQMGVTEGRLQAVGKGSAAPVPGSSPYSGLNRRVVVVNTEG